MSEANNERIRELLRKAIPPATDRELGRDLWPLIPFLVIPLAFTIAKSLGFLAVTSGGLVWLQAITMHYPFVATWFLGALIVYYLVWKYLVGFFNELLGIA